MFMPYADKKILYSTGNHVPANISIPQKTKIFIVKTVSNSDQENLSKTTGYTAQSNDCTVVEFVYSATDINSMLR
jgi:hypothetical protein